MRTATLLRTLALLLLSAVTAPAGADVVTFGDPVLEREIRDALSIPSGIDIQSEDMFALHDLSISDPALRSLAGLEHALHLQSIGLYGVAATDMEPLRELEWLGSVVINDTGLQDPSFCAGYTRLFYLSLADNNISDISGIEGLTMRDKNLSLASLLGNPLNTDAYERHLPRLEDRNPLASFHYDPLPEPGTLFAVAAGSAALLRRTRRR